MAVILTEALADVCIATVLVNITSDLMTVKSINALLSEVLFEIRVGILAPEIWKKQQFNTKDFT